MSYRRRYDDSPRRGYDRRSPDYDRGRSRRSPSPRRRRRSPSYDRRRRSPSYERRRSPNHNRRNSGGRYGGNRRRGGYGGFRGNRRSPSPQITEMLDHFRHPSLSLEKPAEDDCRELSIRLEEKEVAYVFGRMGTCKDKLARVSGTHMQLQGSALVVSGTDNGIDRAEKYVKILLAQRHGKVKLDRSEHTHDLTLVEVPTTCKGFITGKRGATLRQIERECATLMTFCSDRSNTEPLAIFGNRHARLAAQLKVMSIVEGKEDGWFIKSDGPRIKISDNDIRRDGDNDWGVSRVKLESDMLGYALGKKGDTRLKLEVAAGCIIQYIGLWAVFGGRKAARSRGECYLRWLLAQRNSNFKATISGRSDVTVLWVPEPSVSYVTGKKAMTLRNLEAKSGTFCFFDKMKTTHRNGQSKEKMLIFAGDESHRKAAVDEVKIIVDFHQRKIGGNGSVNSDHSHSRSVSHSGSPRSTSRRNSRSGSGSVKQERSVSRDRSRSRSRSRSYTRSRSRD